MSDLHEPKPENNQEPQRPESSSMGPAGPQQPGSADAPTPDQAKALAELDLKSARTLSTVAAIAGPVSFIIGGIALSTVALVCAIIGFVKIKHVETGIDDRQKAYAAAVRQTLVWGLVIGAIALVVNIVGVALMMPVLMEAMQTGDFSSILGQGANVAAPSSGGGGNAWG